METVTSPGNVVARPPPLRDHLKTAGTILAGRYRIVGLLGRGGMGEVYRADDLKLAQPVALKFLPVSVANEPVALARFHNEVRVARQVSHPNVCRIYDLNEADGQHFLSMEYVDGEDLSSLLRRIGRLPADKAVQSARQLCAGLAAAHDLGVLHRDLKPANVMLDGRGTVKITDFGLADFAEQIRYDDIAGTPAYMAPEQLAGGAATIRSDLYALGLVLFEMFTGAPAFARDSAEDRARASRNSAPPPPSQALPDIDPAAERVIVRCLDPDPAGRPASARVIAAALPGGDPLAAALAAGLTPSPQMVADAGAVGTLRPAVAWGLFAALVIGLTAIAAINDRVAIYRTELVRVSPDVLRTRARQILERAGWSAEPLDRAAGFAFDLDVSAQLARDPSAAQWRRAESGRPGLLRFWYRESDAWLIPWSLERYPTSGDPPPSQPGATVMLDRVGNLERLTIVLRPGIEVPSAATPSDWSGLFEAAGLRLSAFDAVDPSRVAPVSSDLRFAWIERAPQEHAMRRRVEAAAMGGRPVHFEIVSPYPPGTLLSTVPLGGMVLLAGLVISLILAAALLARRNVRLGRSDRSAAFRIALFNFALFAPLYLFGVHHIPGIEEVIQLLKAAIVSLAYAAVFWLAYVAIEPLVRRRWPDLIVSSTRLVAGRPRDPLIGRDFLMGATLAIASVVLGASYSLWTTALELPRQGLPPPYVLAPLYSAGQVIGQFAWILVLAVQNALGVMLLLLVLTIVLRRRWLATAAFFLIAVALLGIGGGSPVVVIAWAALVALVVTRYGILAMAANTLFVLTATWFPLTLDLNAFYFASSLIPIVLLLGLAWCALYITLGGKPLGGWTERGAI
jgi:serine/threonine-protein kinase